MVKMKYSEIMGFPFSQAIQKIASTPTHGAKAAQIHKVIKQLSAARKEIQKQFWNDIAEVYGKRDEAGKLVRPDGDEAGFEPIEEKKEELLAAQEAFGNSEVAFNAQPFSLQTLEDVKISAKDLEALGALFTGNADESKPAIPTKLATVG